MGISALLFVVIVGFVVGCLIGGSIVGHFVMFANDRVKEDLSQTRGVAYRVQWRAPEDRCRVPGSSSLT